jgi:dihydrofolate synthase / folylpolyglutamate synthase
MNYKEAIEYIENTGKFGINLGLQRIERLCTLLGNPEKNLKIIHVGGTNGKGSTTTFISSVLMKQGYRVGIYTSPYIERFTERIKINETEIREEEIASNVNEMLPLIEVLISEGLEHPTEFEIITAAAFKYFKDNKVDFVVLEVGLGGRYDATNVVTPIISVITTISLDHVNILGDTLEKIAFEKAGIIKENIPVVIYPQEEKVMEVLLGACEEKNSKPFFVRDIEFEILSDTEDGIIFNASSQINYNKLIIKLLGEHQVLNCLTALKGIEVLQGMGYQIGVEAIYNGFRAAAWPGRFEIITQDPHIVLDGGHNIQGIHGLVEASKKYFKNKKIRIVCGMLKDKNYEEMIRELMNISDNFITVTPNNPRALPGKELKKAIVDLGKAAVAVDSIREAVEIGLREIKSGEVLLFCGSLYMIGEARTIINNTVNKS